MASVATEVSVAGRVLKLTNLDKVLYPSGFTKAQVIHYYTAIAPVLLPHLKNRPVTLKRYPDGVDGESFYEKHAPKHRPDWVKTVEVESSRSGTIGFVLVDDLPTLTWLANLAALELHTSLGLAAHLDIPAALAFDLDPGPPADLRQCAQVALWIRALLAPLGLLAFAKTSGQKGLQVYLPLNGRQTYAATKPFAHAVARLLEERHPQAVTSEMKKELRPGKVFIDWSQNDPHKTTVNVYSLRAVEVPSVSAPLDWEEVEALAAAKALPARFTADQVLKRVERRGDLFAAVLQLEQKVPETLPSNLRGVAP